jgi:hypothetical protein
LEILGKSLEKFGISLEKLGFSLERLGEIWPPPAGAIAPIVGLAASKRTPRGAPARALELSAVSVLSPLFDTIRRYNCSQAVVRLRDMEESS